jgi:dihydrofolate synthase/folylpolyglutamate synthase
MERTLDQWLDHQLRTHPQQIAMGLDRVRAVHARLGADSPGALVATVGGTNGKGSTVAFLEAIARAAGLRVGAFTSPHLLRYNERIRIDGQDVDDATLVRAFERIEAARGDIPLTYFEFGTLAALLVFAQSGLDLAILEVGLGGRLDAVNIVDAHVAVLTTVDLDHQEYLGGDRETIGADKAGIFRAGKPCVLGERDPPSSVLAHAYRIGAFAIRAQSDYLIERHGRHWTWREPGYAIELPTPLLDAPAQVDNAAAAIAALRALPVDIPDAALREGVAAARAPGRLQRIGDAPQVLVDVAHNPQAARQLAAWLAQHARPTQAVYAALRDKDVAAVAGELDPLVEHWHLAGIADAGLRDLSGAELATRLDETIPPGRRTVHADIATALARATHAAGPDGRVLVFGSFHTVAEVLRTVGAGTGRV